MDDIGGAYFQHSQGDQPRDVSACVEARLSLHPKIHLKIRPRGLACQVYQSLAQLYPLWGEEPLEDPWRASSELPTPRLTRAAHFSSLRVIPQRPWPVKLLKPPEVSAGIEVRGVPGSLCRSEGLDTGRTV